MPAKEPNSKTALSTGAVDVHHVDSRIDSLEKRLELSLKKSDSILSALGRKGEYEQILEKTNDQLSLWYNPHGLFVDSLGVLFAVGAIVVGVILFRQSKEYKEAIDGFWKRKEAELDAFLAERKGKLGKIEIDMDTKMSEMQASIDKFEKTTEAKAKDASLEKIKADLEVLKIERKAFSFKEPPLNLGTAISASGYPTGYAGVPIFMQKKLCTNPDCRNVFSVPMGWGTPTVTFCPRCTTRVD